MTDLAIITPTRGRPDRFAEMVDAVMHTAELDWEVWAGLDYDDSRNYHDLLLACPRVVGTGGLRRSLSGWTNLLATTVLAGADPPRYLASLGDDHRPRTPGWDRLLVDAIEERGGTGIAYGNDLFQGANLPTAWVVSADIVHALGWMMLPTLGHMYVDNATLELGWAAGCITYRPDVIVEHLHPVAGKAAWDKSYRETNTPARYEADQVAFEAWQRDGLAADAARVRALTAAAVP
jgi:hypothetical protein